MWIYFKSPSSSRVLFLDGTFRKEKLNKADLKTSKRRLVYLSYSVNAVENGYRLRPFYFPFLSWTAALLR
ncbi:CLUMA_CG010907, isoform A [Clunio marinus]|uniref:CLUMA_CG010907, isoform A n=1 Tax=Clunio marinus TaxID=568069 RepID=A0A1J1IEU0_9DIPT|nr:CLUMA_CG010907, isoform A [Clunio marinus]